MVKQLYINGVGTGQFDIYISSDTFLNSPEIAYEAYEVPALDGSLLKYDKRLNNVIRRFDCFCKSNVNVNIAQLKKLLYSNRGYMRIESDYDPNYYQMGYLAEGIEFTPFDASGAYEVQFSLYFSCKPTKLYKTTTPFTTTAIKYGQISAIYSRNDPYMQELFAQMPVEDIPDAEFFATLTIHDALSTVGDYTITSTEKTFLGLVCAYRTFSNESDSYALKGYANNTDSLTVTGVKKEYTYETWKAITTLHVDTVQTVLTDGTTTYTNQSKLGQDGHGEATEPTAMGANLHLTASMRIDSEYRFSSAPTFFCIRGFFQSNETFSALWEFNTPSARENGLDKVIADYGYSDSVYTDKRLEFVFDLDTYDIYVTNDDNQKKVTSYFVLIGSMEGFCDEITVTMYTSNLSPYFTRVTITPEWWTV